MTRIAFAKAHGTENDFVLLPDAAVDVDLTADVVRFLCDRRAGLGADGVIRVARAAELLGKGVLDCLPDGVEPEHWFMDYRNADGSLAEMCGNGVRVFAHWVYSRGLVDDAAFVVGTRAGAREDINLHINQGETIGIIGGTGSAKSALVQLIPRLYDVLEGEVKVGGINVKNYDIKTLRDNVAMVLQKNVLFSGTIKENLMWGNKNATEEEIIHACKLAQADEFIQKFPDKYDTYIEQGGSNVSGGQKQRLCIARALLKNPKILILDDSTSAVDTKTDKLIREAFKNEIPDITKIIIAQRISSVKDADKIIVLDDGKVTGIGIHEELIISNDIYKEVHNSQEEGGKNNE